MPNKTQENPQTTTQTANDNQEKPNQSGIEALDFSADNIRSEWTDNTHLDEIVEKSEEEVSEYDEISGLKKSEIYSKEEFFTDFFCHNMELAEALTGWVGLSVVVSDGKPEIGAKETSNILYDQCQKFKLLHWAIKRDDGWIVNVVPIMIFAKSKGQVIGQYMTPPKPEENQPAANDNAEPLDIAQ